VCFHRSTPPDGTNPQMALIYRSLPRNCLQSSSESTASRALQYLSHQIASSDQRNLVFSPHPEDADPQSEIGQLEWAARKLPMPLGVRSRQEPGPGAGRLPQHCLFGPSLGACPRGLAWAMLPCCGPVPWGPWHGDVQTLRWIHLPSCRPAQPDLSLLNRALLSRAARKKAASGRTGPGANRSGSETNGADGPGFCSLIPLF